MYLRKRKKERREKYMFSKKEFEIALLKYEKSKDDIAKILNVNLATLYRKMNGSSDFYRDEIQAISDYLNLSLDEKESIFFN
jgi:betR domain